MTELNRVSLLVGPSQYGKSTIVRRLVFDHLRDHKRGLAFVHDPHWQFSDLCRTYTGAEEWRAAYAKARDTRAQFERGASIRGSSSEVRDLAVAIGERSNSMSNVRVPLLYACDESSLMDSSSKTYATKEDLALLSNRRHYGIHVVMNVQAVENLTESWYQQATEVYVLSQISVEKTREVERRIGIKRDYLAGMVDAPKFKYAHWRRGEGLV